MQQQNHAMTGLYYCRYRKESDYTNDLCSSCFQLTYLKDTLQFISCNVDNGGI
jgi:hypothetical protein